jgi:hypothetical protein
VRGSLKGLSSWRGPLIRVADAMQPLPASGER